MTSRRRGPRLAVALLAAATVLCVLLVDRPVATYMHRAVYSTAMFTWAMRLFPVLLVAGGCLLVLFLGVGASALVRRSIHPWMSIALVASGAGIAGFLSAALLKFVIGRSQVYPAFLVDGIYRVSPLHGGLDHGAFPSATATVASAVLLVLWFRWPRARPAYGFLLATISAALIVTNSHWVSDLLGGVLLGGSVGWAVLRSHLGSGATR